MHLTVREEGRLDFNKGLICVINCLGGQGVVVVKFSFVLQSFLISDVLKFTNPRRPCRIFLSTFFLVLIDQEVTESWFY